MRQVRAQPARGQPRLRLEAHVALAAENLAGFENVLLRHQQIDVAGIAQRGILKGGDGQGNALENPKIDLLLAEEAIQGEEMRGTLQAGVSIGHAAWHAALRLARLACSRGRRCQGCEKKSGTTL